MAKLKIKKGFVSQKVGDKITIFDGEESVLYTFNGTATFIFEKIKQGLSNAKISELLTKRYNVTRKRALSDIHELLNELKEKKIIA